MYITTATAVTPTVFKAQLLSHPDKAGFAAFEMGAGSVRANPPPRTASWAWFGQVIIAVVRAPGRHNYHWDHHFGVPQKLRKSHFTRITCFCVSARTFASELNDLRRLSQWANHD